MKWIAILLLITISFFTAESQAHPYSVKFSYEIEQELADGKISSSRAGILYSLIGDYPMSAFYSDIPISWDVDSMTLSSYDTRHALPYIVKQAQDHRIVIISENHLKPQHRIFADKIIIALAKHGFNHLGLETFSNVPDVFPLLDSALISRGYPLDSPITGTYTMEPQMGQLVRNALLHGYRPFAYERSERIKGKDRDEIQADNIIQYLEANPEARIIILCGFHHVIESNLIKRKNAYWMANYLKKKTGINPLTIYQDNFTEKFSENEHPLLTIISISQPSMLVDKDSIPVKLSNNVDIEIIHPRTTYKEGRPTWLYKNAGYLSYPVKLKENARYPIIVSAYPIDEKGGVPFDRIELKHKNQHKALVLKSGTYRITIFDGKSTSEYIESIK